MALKATFYGMSALGACFGGAVLLRERIGGQPYDDELEYKMVGKTTVITGANSGIGLQTAREIARRGGRVIMACRDLEDCERAKASLRERIANKSIECRELDLASIESIRKFADGILESEKHLEVLINNAAVMQCPKELTKDGFEMQLGVNYLGHFLLTNLLLERLKQSAPSRIVNVTSVSHKDGVINFEDLNSAKNYDPKAAYNQSKLALILFTMELARRLEGTGVTANSVYPGISKSRLDRHIGYGKSKVSRGITVPFVSPIKKTSLQGAQTSVFAGVEPTLEKVSGKYFSNCEEATPAPNSQDEEVAKRLWITSEKWTGLS